MTDEELSIIESHLADLRRSLTYPPRARSTVWGETCLRDIPLLIEECRSLRVDNEHRRIETQQSYAETEGLRSEVRRHVCDLVDASERLATIAKWCKTGLDQSKNSASPAVGVLYQIAEILR